MRVEERETPSPPPTRPHPTPGVLLERAPFETKRCDLCCLSFLCQDVNISPLRPPAMSAVNSLPTPPLSACFMSPRARVPRGPCFRVGVAFPQIRRFTSSPVCECSWRICCQVLPAPVGSVCVICPSVAHFKAPRGFARPSFDCLP